MQLFSELKRRNVFRVAAAYAVVFWLVIQVATTIEEPLGLPDWFDTFIIVAMAIGFPVALLISWAFELTPQGLKSTRQVDTDDSITHSTGRKLDRAIIVVLLLAVAWFAWDRFGADAPADTAVAATSELSLAVLPFVNMSRDPDNEYFSDGISEELLNAIVRMNMMDVIGRTSSFQFKGQNLDLREIGKTLSATHILEGSVRRDQNRVRITAQLIEAETGLHLWSDSYDRELIDVFEVQADVAAAIARELSLTLNGTTYEDTAVAHDNEAYDLYLKSRQALVDHTFSSLNNAAEWIDRAIQLDPEFGLLYVTKANLYLDSGRIGVIDDVEAARLAMPLLDMAAENGAGNDGNWHFARAIAFSYLGRNDEANVEIQLAYASNPVDTRIIRAYAARIVRPRDGTQAAIKLLEDAGRLDPLDYWIPFNISSHYERILKIEKAQQYFLRTLELAPSAPTPSAFYGIFLMNNGQPVAGLQQLQQSALLDASDPESYTFPASALLSMGLYEEALGQADRALAVNPNSAHARYLKAAALYLNTVADMSREEATSKAEEILATTLQNPDSLYRRVGQFVDDFYAMLAVRDGNAEEAITRFRGSVPDFERMVTGLPPSVSGNPEWGAWQSLAAYIRFLRHAGKEDEANRLAPRLDWITEETVTEGSDGILNRASLYFLIDTRAGFVDDAVVLAWIDELHRLGAFYDWRMRLSLNSGLVLMEDQDGLQAALARFEASMATARKQYLSQRAER